VPVRQQSDAQLRLAGGSATVPVRQQSVTQLRPTGSSVCVPAFIGGGSACVPAPQSPRPAGGSATVPVRQQSVTQLRPSGSSACVTAFFGGGSVTAPQSPRPAGGSALVPARQPSGSSVCVAAWQLPGRPHPQAVVPQPAGNAFGVTAWPPSCAQCELPLSPNKTASVSMQRPETPPRYTLSARDSLRESAPAANAEERLGTALRSRWFASV